MKKIAYVIRHIAFESLGNLESILLAQHFDIKIIEAFYGNFDILQHSKINDILIILGGPIGVYEIDEYPFLKKEIDIIKTWVLNNKPTLGICLGAQLIASALGAKVYIGHQKEIGWKGIQEVNVDQFPFMGWLSSKQTKVLHWHGDTFDLPQSTVLLASTDLYPNQAFTYKKRCLALQFHPEVTQECLEQWYIGHRTELIGLTKGAILELKNNTVQYIQDLEHNAKRFWESWFEFIS